MRWFSVIFTFYLMWLFFFNSLIESTIQFSLLRLYVWFLLFLYFPFFQRPHSRLMAVVSIKRNKHVNKCTATDHNTLISVTYSSENAFAVSQFGMRGFEILFNLKFAERKIAVTDTEQIKMCLNKMFAWMFFFCLIPRAQNKIRFVFYCHRKRICWKIAFYLFFFFFSFFDAIRPSYRFIEDECRCCVAVSKNSFFISPNTFLSTHSQHQMLSYCLKWMMVAITDEALIQSFVLNHGYVEHWHMDMTAIAQLTTHIRYVFDALVWFWIIKVLRRRRWLNVFDPILVVHFFYPMIFVINFTGSPTVNRFKKPISILYLFWRFVATITNFYTIAVWKKYKKKFMSNWILFCGEREKPKKKDSSEQNMKLWV